MKLLLAVQSAYYFITAIWPLVHIKSFMIVTGPKTDIWLVKTVGALLVPVSLAIALPLFVETPLLTATLLAAGCCIAFISIDVYYSLNGTISKVYLLDAVAQGILLGGWAIVWVTMW